MFIIAHYFNLKCYLQFLYFNYILDIIYIYFFFPLNLYLHFLFQLIDVITYNSNLKPFKEPCCMTLDSYRVLVGPFT